MQIFNVTVYFDSEDGITYSIAMPFSTEDKALDFVEFYLEDVFPDNVGFIVTESELDQLPKPDKIH